MHGRLKNGFLELLDGGFLPEMLGDTKILEEAPAFGGIDKVPARERRIGAVRLPTAGLSSPARSATRRGVRAEPAA